MKRNPKLIARIMITAIGLIICGIGIGLFLFTHLGADPTSVFQLGIANQLDISYGSASALMNIVIIIIMVFIGRKYINIATILAIFMIGYSADITNRILQNLIQIELTLVIRIILSMIGSIIMAIGIPIYTYANLGVGAVDLLSEMITDRTEFQYRYVRISMDSFFVVTGYLLGGTLGLGTFIAVVLTGPVVQVTRPHINRFLDRLIGG